MKGEKIMAKVSFSSLKLKANTEVKTIDYNNITIEVSQYLSVNDKYDLINVVLVATGAVALLGKVKFNDMLNGFGAGAKRALRPAFVTSLLYIMNDR